MKEPIKLYNVLFAMQLGLYDVWRIHGTKDGKEWLPSTPVNFNEDDLQFQTASGSIYKIMSFDCNKEKFIQELKETISRGHFERF